MDRGRDKFNKYKNVLYALSRIVSIFPYSIRIKFFEIIRNTKGLKGIGLRYIILKSLAKKCGDNVSIHPGVYIFNINELIIGNNVSIHPMCYLECHGGISIGNDVSIAHSTSILSTSHNFRILTEPINNQGVSNCPVAIADNVWVGCKVTILGNVNISTGVVIGANSLVNSDIQKNSIVAGVPARMIKERI